MFYTLRTIFQRPTLIACAIFTSTTPIIAHNENTIITQKEAWMISSPKLTKPLAYLQDIGERAHTIWLSRCNQHDAIASFQELFHCVDKDFLYELINQILHDEMLLKKVAQASYRNVTGFLKVVLVSGDDADAWKIRLHIWEQKEEKEFPHSHKWDFYSKIITGYLLQDIYEKNYTVCDPLNAHSVREPVSLMPASDTGVLPCPCRDNYILNPKNTDAPIVSLRIESTNIIGNGESYLMPHHLVHAINPGRGSMSLVFTSQKITDNSDVFVPMNMVNSNLNRYAPSVTPEELKLELIKVQKMLSQLSVHETYLPEMVDVSHHYYHINRNDPITKSAHWREELHAIPNRKLVIQLSKEALEEYRISADADGKILINEKPINPASDYLFLLFNGMMYAAAKDFNHESNLLICHTSFSDYGPVDSAGVLRFDAQGNLTIIEAYSGHYCPLLRDMDSAQKHLTAIGVNTAYASCSMYQDRAIPTA